MKGLRRSLIRLLHFTPAAEGPVQKKKTNYNRKPPKTRTVCEPSPSEAAASTLSVAENHLEANLTNSPSKVMKKKLEEKLVKSREKNITIATENTTEKEKCRLVFCD
ncbi:hypothetical protein Hamer_G018325 [Homarus americanus]|uniref:Uncharacterized protein n=1 Tax=Homarus americanus TaxID=6706 RepID=A0A8J5JRC8_HOMAM|nr:hypothetical protein Hamer_G018325 [Homarus americanus]